MKRKWDEFQDRRVLEAGTIAYFLTVGFFISNKVALYFSQQPWTSEAGVILWPMATFLIWPWIYRATANSFRRIKWLGYSLIPTFAGAAWLYYQGDLFSIKGLIGFVIIALSSGIVFDYVLRPFFRDIWFDQVGKHLRD